MDDDEITAALRGGLLDGRELRRVPLERLNLDLPLIDLEPGEFVAAWEAARGVVDRTGRFPVIVLEYGDSPDQVEEVLGVDADPTDLLARAATLDLDAAYEAWQEDRLATKFYAEHWDVEAAGELASSKTGLTLADAEAAGVAYDWIAFQRWLMHWEQSNLHPPAPIANGDALNWIGDEWSPAGLAFLPTPAPEAFAAYLDVYFADAHGMQRERLVATAARWNRRFGAEVVASLGVNVWFRLAQPPEDLDTAFDLALEQLTIARQTGNNLSIRDHARALVGRNEWQLYERP